MFQIKYFKMFFIIPLVFLSGLLKGVQGFMITVDAHETACFYDRALEKDKISIRFEVMDGGFKDIAVSITGPNDDILFESDSETSGSYTFSAVQSGRHMLCFNNERSTLSPKVLMFHFTVIKDLKYYNNPKERSDDIVEQSILQENINTLSSQMMAIRHEQEYMHARYIGHEKISQSVHFRIVAWSIFGPSLLLLMTVVEIYYLKRFFEVRRVV